MARARSNGSYTLARYTGRGVYRYAEIEYALELAPTSSGVGASVTRLSGPFNRFPKTLRVSSAEEAVRRAIEIETSLSEQRKNAFQGGFYDRFGRIPTGTSDSWRADEADVELYEVLAYVTSGWSPTTGFQHHRGGLKLPHHWELEAPRRARSNSAGRTALENPPKHAPMHEGATLGMCGAHGTGSDIMRWPKDVTCRACTKRLWSAWQDRGLYPDQIPLTRWPWDDAKWENKVHKNPRSRRNPSDGYSIEMVFRKSPRTALLATAFREVDGVVDVTSRGTTEGREPAVAIRVWLDVTIPGMDTMQQIQARITQYREHLFGHTSYPHAGHWSRK